MDRIARFFLSVKTAVGIFTAFTALAIAGSFSLVRNLAFFSGIDDTPLLSWLTVSGGLRTTWWIYAMIAALGLLAVNTVFCTVTALLKRTTWKNILLKLSPEAMHIGVLFIMLGHLLTASAGFKSDLVINKGERRTVADAVLTLHDVRLRTDLDGYVTDFDADVEWAGAVRQRTTLRPVHPLYFGQFGVYLKSVTLEPEATAQIRVCRDPGAIWALLGGVLLSAGGICFLWGRTGTP